MSKQLTLTVTEEHLDKAIYARENNLNESICRTCLIAQAGISKFGNNFIECDRDYIKCTNNSVYSSEEIRRLIKIFDNNYDEYEDLRASLPVTFSLQKRDHTYCA